MTQDERSMRDRMLAGDLYIADSEIAPRSIGSLPANVVAATRVTRRVDQE